MSQPMQLKNFEALFNLCIQYKFPAFHSVLYLPFSVLTKGMNWCLNENKKGESNLQSMQ